MSNGGKQKRKFSSKRKEEEVEIDDVPYVIREMMGPELSKWTSLNADRVQLKNGVPVGMKAVDDLYASLICLCLYSQDGKLVDKAKISAWPASLQKELYFICQAMNALDDDAKDAEKKG